MRRCREDRKKGRQKGREKERENEGVGLEGGTRVFFVAIDPGTQQCRSVPAMLMEKIVVAINPSKKMPRQSLACPQRQDTCFSQFCIAKVT